MLVGDPRRARLEHVHGRQVAPVPRRRDEPRVDAAELAERSWLRALVRVPRRRDEPVVSRPGLRQPPRRPAEVAGGGLPPRPWTSPTRRSSSSGTRRRSRPRSRSSSTTRPARATRRTTRRRSGSTSTRAVRHGYEAMREQTLARQKEMGIVPPDTELPPINPIGTPETRTGPDGMPFPTWTSRGRGTRSRTTRRRCSAGWPRSTPGSSRTPTTRSAGCSASWRSSAGGRTRSSSWSIRGAVSRHNAAGDAMEHP